MKITIAAIGQKLPSWMQEGISDYQERLPRQHKISIKTRAPSTLSTKEQRQAEEARFLLGQRGKRDFLIACDERGECPASEAFGGLFKRWLASGQDLTLILGGPDGLDPQCRQEAGYIWALSPLTFPHGVARLLAVEQLYRAWSMTQNHPYHRA